MFEARGSNEIILKLFQIYESASGGRVDALAVWKAIAAYSCGPVKPKFRFYVLSDYNPEKPDGEYLEDVGRLIEGRKVDALLDGSLRLTGLGRLTAIATRLPESLDPLGEKIREMARGCKNSA